MCFKFDVTKFRNSIDQSSNEIETKEIAISHLRKKPNAPKRMIRKFRPPTRPKRSKIAQWEKEPKKKIQKKKKKFLTYLFPLLNVNFTRRSTCESWTSHFHVIGFVSLVDTYNFHWVFLRHFFQVGGGCFFTHFFILTFYFFWLGWLTRGSFPPPILLLVAIFSIRYLLLLDWPFFFFSFSFLLPFFRNLHFVIDLD